MNPIPNEPAITSIRFATIRPDNTEAQWWLTLPDGSIPGDNTWHLWLVYKDQSQLKFDCLHQPDQTPKPFVLGSKASRIKAVINGAPHIDSFHRTRLTIGIQSGAQSGSVVLDSGAGTQATATIGNATFTVEKLTLTPNWGDVVGSFDTNPDNTPDTSVEFTVRIH